MSGPTANWQRKYIIQKKGGSSVHTGEKKRSGEEARGGHWRREGLRKGWEWGSMLRRGASFSSAICSWFCKLEVLFVSNASHALGAARQRAAGTGRSASVTCFKQPQDVTHPTAGATFDEAVHSVPRPPRRLIRWTNEEDSRKQREVGEIGRAHV